MCGRVTAINNKNQHLYQEVHNVLALEASHDCEALQVRPKHNAAATQNFPHPPTK
jgi:hypothetical protein